MRVNKTGGHILAFQVDFLFSGKIADPDDHSVGDGNVSFLHTVRKNIDNLRIFQNQIRRYKLSGGLRAAHIFFKFHRKPLSAADGYYFSRPFLRLTMLHSIRRFTRPACSSSSFPGFR